MSIKLKEKVYECLQNNPGQKFTARELADWIFEHYRSECIDKKNRSKAIKFPINSNLDLVKEIASNIATQTSDLKARYEHVKTIEGQPPRKYFYSDSVDGNESENIEGSFEKSVSESHLYPILAKYLWSEYKIYVKRVNEKRSSNTQGLGANRWLYPDLVGMENLSRDWHQEIKESAKAHFDKLTKLWSFEVKVLVNRSNIRQAFFQAVSNSSWANCSYLVASEIEGTDTMKELRILSALHGIGFIDLNVDNPSESQIIIPARERSEVDWDTANRLAEENRDFLKFIQLVRQFYQSGIINNEWEVRLDSESL